MRETTPVYDTLVIGGGINGLATLAQLLRRGRRPVGLLEQFTLGHDQGSSHGPTRITRSTYASADYVRLMQRAQADEWPALERDLGRTLIHRAPGCFFGPPGQLFEQYAAAVAAAGAQVERIDSAAARRLFPQFRFAGADAVLLDHTAGIIAAADTLAGLAAWCRGHGAHVRESCPVQHIDVTADPIIVQTAQGPLATARLVVTAGAWVRELVPALRARLQVIRQTVGYFQLTGAEADVCLGRFPVWVHLDDRPERFFYGLPEFGRPGIKLARHFTHGRDDDPNEAEHRVDPAEIRCLEEFIAEQFTLPLRTLAGAEHCLYTNTATEDFVLDRHPDNPNVVIGSACSGHGFKFGPLTGRILADLVTDGRCDIPEFVAARQRFRL